MKNDVAMFAIGVIGIVCLLIIGVIAFVIVSEWKLFKKAGKPGWASIVPVYNTIVMLEIIGYKWYYIFMFFAGGIPFVGSIILMLFMITYNIKFAKSFGQEVGFGIGLWLLSPIFVAILAFNKNMKYVGPAVKGDIDFNDLF